MLDSSRRSILNPALIGFVLLVIVAIDFLLPGSYLVTSLLALPMLLATITVGPRGVAVTVLAAFAVAVASSIIHQPPFIVSLFRLLGVSAIGGLAILLSLQRQRADRQSIERETARRQVSEILESIGDGFFALDHVGRLTYVNRQAERFLGRDREMIVGEPAWALFPAETRDAFQEAAATCAATRQPVHVETHDAVSGEWYEVHVYPSVTGLSIYFRDFTVRKRAEEGRREAEAKYRGLVEQVPAITYRIEKGLGDGSTETTAEYISPQLEEMLGYKVAEWMANPRQWSDHLHPDDRDRVLKANARANQTGESLRIEYRMITANGNLVWVRDQATVVPHEDSDRRTWQGIIFDITAEKEAEVARAESAGKFAFLAETSRLLTAMQPDYSATLGLIADLIVPQLADWAIVYLVDGETIQRGAVAFARPEDAPLAARLDSMPVMVRTKRQIRETLALGHVLYLPDLEDADDIHEVLREEEAELLRDMQLGPAVLMPVRARGNLLGVLFLARSAGASAYTPDDVSFIEEVVHRFALVLDNARLYEEARIALAAREEFLSVAAHELRTPLTGIKGYIQLLERRLNRGPQSMDTVRQTLDSLRPQLARFERIVEDLLEVTRIERNELSIHKEYCDLSEIASNVFDAAVTSSEHSTSQPMKLIVPESLPGYWDSTRIAQVIENLLSNALRYSLGRGEVELRVEQEGDFAVIMTRDQGIGISPEEQQHVFDPFFRGDALAGKVEGSGLGLAITKRIVEQHGGTITVESTPGQGSTFTVRMPIGPIHNAPIATQLVEEVVEH